MSPVAAARDPSGDPEQDTVPVAVDAFELSGRDALTNLLVEIRTTEGQQAELEARRQEKKVALQASKHRAEHREWLLSHALTTIDGAQRRL